MSDKELLELAAEAAGIVALRWGIDAPERQMSGEGQFIGATWNPLNDDGDALRLAADLRLKVLPGKHKGDGCTVETQRAGITGVTTFRDDKREQMRRAIVMAAAAIGAGMP